MSVVIPKNQKFIFQRATIIKPGIELIGIINKRGKMMESIGPGNINMPKAKEEMFLMKIALRNSMQRDFDEELGPVNYCMTQRGNRKFISIPTFNGNTVLAVTKHDYDQESLVKDISLTLKYSDQFLGESRRQVQI